MKILAGLLGYFSLVALSGAADPQENSVFSRGDAEFVEALVVSFLIVCVYLLYWLKNKGQH